MKDDEQKPAPRDAKALDQTNTEEAYNEQARAVIRAMDDLWSVLEQFEDFQEWRRKNGNPPCRAPNEPAVSSLPD